MKITSFHIEASTYCNARCPGCPRNIRGYNLKNFVNQTHLSPKRYAEIRQKYLDLERVRINGGLGDPMMNPDIYEIVTISNCETQITTNGSIGTRKTFEQLAAHKVQIEFSIDGLEDTNHLYRQDVPWNNIMDRVKWFINAGGEAYWKWVPFKHNHHQLADAKAMAKDLGFKDFYTNAQQRDDFPALDKHGNLSHWIEPHDRPSVNTKQIDSKAMIQQMATLTRFMPETGKMFSIDSCEHLQGEVYITAKGEVTPCCYHGTNIGDRVSVPVEKFDQLQKTWNTNNCDPTCANSCGKLINVMR